MARSILYGHRIMILSPPHPHHQKFVHIEWFPCFIIRHNSSNIVDHIFENSEFATSQRIAMCVLMNSDTIWLSHLSQTRQRFSNRAVPPCVNKTMDECVRALGSAITIPFQLTGYCGDRQGWRVGSDTGGDLLGNCDANNIQLLVVFLKISKSSLKSKINNMTQIQIQILYIFLYSLWITFFKILSFELIDKTNLIKARY